MRLSLTFSLLSVLCLHATMAMAQEHTHGDGGAAAPRLAPPTVFLDKSPRIVEYQLKRLDNQRLLLVERNVDDRKYIPVYQSILSRVGMSPQHREESVAALVALQQSDPVTVLLSAIAELDAADREQRRAAGQLALMLLRQGDAVLKSKAELLSQTAAADGELLRSIAFAALISADQFDSARARLADGDRAQTAFLAAFAWIPDPSTRSALRDDVVRLLTASQAADVKREAINALGFIQASPQANIELVAPLVAQVDLRDAAVKTLLKMPADQFTAAVSSPLVRTLVEQAEATPPEERTSIAFIDGMQLAERVMLGLPSSEASEFRQRLRAVTVRLVRIKTVEEEMRYDVPYFAVQAGESLQIVLENHDLMPHNLVLTVPGALKEVVQLGLQAGPNGGWNGLPYVPHCDKVLQATPMVPADGQARLTFTAPLQVGEYPYVCTFPQHWYRMYGVMVVVADLDAWLKKPLAPANPIGSNRTFVQSWTVDDLAGELESGLRGRSADIGKKIFAEASCAGCHRVGGEGGVIGPELTDVWQRWKGDRLGVLREILEPSHKVDAKYAMQRVLTVDGRTITGVLIQQDDAQVSLLSSPETQEPTIIRQDEIDAMIPSSVSMMPKALLDQYTKDEILELLAYLESVNPK